MRKTLTALIVFLLFLVIFLRSSFINKPNRAQSPVNGSIEYNGSQRILNLWGTNYEMGYAHGYLLADEIMNMIEGYLIDFELDNSQDKFDTMATGLSTKYYFTQDYENELQGLYDGMAASGKDLYLDFKGRNVTILDLKMWNAFLDYVAQCSSFAVWGSSSSDEKTYHARNFDLSPGYNTYFTNYSLLKTVDPQDPNLNNWVSMSWPGFIGAVSGMNEYRIVITANYVHAGEVNPDNTQNIAHGLIYRSALEKAGATDPVGDVVNLLNSIQRPSGLNIQVSYPYDGVNDSSAVIETDGYETVVRTADFTNPGIDHIITTNHFLQNDPTNEGGKKSFTRYEQILDGVNNLYATGDGKIDFSEARTTVGLAFSEGTNHTVVYNPQDKMFDLSFAQFSDPVPTVITPTPIDITPAFMITPQAYNWSDLFPNHESPTATPTPTNTPTPTPVPTIIIDNKDAGFSVTGSWSTKITQGGWGNNVRLTTTADILTTPKKSANWMVNIPISGHYQVYAMWEANNNYSSKTSFSIYHNRKVDEVSVNQTKNGDRWNLLGRYYFSSSLTDQKIMLVNKSAVAGKFVCADAVKLVFTILKL